MRRISILLLAAGSLAGGLIYTAPAHAAARDYQLYYDINGDPVCIEGCRWICCKTIPL